MAEEGRVRQRVEREAVIEGRHEETKFWPVWKEIKGRDEAVRRRGTKADGEGSAAEEDRALWRGAAFLDSVDYSAMRVVKRGDGGTGLQGGATGAVPADVTQRS